MDYFTYTLGNHSRDSPLARLVDAPWENVLGLELRCSSSAVVEGGKCKPQESDEDGGLATLEIVLIAIGAFVAAVLICVAICLIAG
jgi:hypothetical protein